LESGIIGGYNSILVLRGYLGAK